MKTIEAKKIKKTIRQCGDLNVYRQSYDLAMRIFHLTQRFPKEETYSLSDQMRRSSRSVPANIAEGWAKRNYRNIFVRHLHDAAGSCEEIKTWVHFAKDCSYLGEAQCEELLIGYNEVGAMLNSLIKNWRSF